MSSISSVSTSTSAPAPLHSGRDKEIQSLMKQKVKLNETLQTVKSNDQIDTKTKAERIKSLTDAIAQLDSKIAQIKAEELQERNQIKQPEQTKQQTPTQDEDQAPSLDHLIKHGQTYDRLGKLVGLRNRMEHSIQTIEGETRFDRIVLDVNAGKDAGKSMMLANAERTVFQKKREAVQEISSQMDKIDDTIGKLTDASQETTAQGPKQPSISSDEKEDIKGQGHSDSTIDPTDSSNNPASSGSEPSSAYASVDIRI